MLSLYGQRYAHREAKLTVKNALLYELLGRGAVRKIVAQTVLHWSVSPKSDVGAVKNKEAHGVGARSPLQGRQGLPATRETWFWPRHSAR